MEDGRGSWCFSLDTMCTVFNQSMFDDVQEEKKTRKLTHSLEKKERMK